MLPPWMYRFSLENLTPVEKSMLKNHTFSERETDYEYLKSENQVRLHGIGGKLLDLFSWDKAKVLFVSSENSQLIVEVQKTVCTNNCFFDPLKCLDGEHDGKLKSLLKKDFHENIPNFYDFFNDGKSDNEKTSKKPNHLFDDDDFQKPNAPLYDDEGYVDINLEALNIKDVADCKPLAELELNKLSNILEAIMEASELSIEIQRKDMYDHFLQNHSGYNPPRLNAMGFGPYCGQIAKYCSQFGESKSLLPDQKWDSRFFWQFQHGVESSCLGVGVSPNKFSFPFYDSNWKICYPCNTGFCHEGCLCELCGATDLLKQEDPEVHKREHLEEYSFCCILNKVQCLDHFIDHPSNFDEKEDIQIKVYNYLDMNLDDEGRKSLKFKRLNKPPRTNGNLQESLKLAGLKKNCALCIKDVNDHLRNHRILHSQCKICEIRSKTIIDEDFWMKTCEDCKLYFPNIQMKDMKRHRKGHDLDFTCKMCNKGFRRLKYLKQHEEDIHKQEDGWKCEICGTTYKQQRNLINHIRLRHTDSEKFKCSLCPKEFLFRFSLNRHLNMKHGVSSSRSTNIFVVKQTEEFFDCAKCGRVLKGKFRLNRHMLEVHEEDKTFKCESCSKSFARNDKLKRHVREVHAVATKLECSVCDQTFARLEYLDRHMLTKHEESDFLCTLCNKVFNRKDNLARHQKTHKRM